MSGDEEGEEEKIKRTGKRDDGRKGVEGVGRMKESLLRDNERRIEEMGRKLEEMRDLMAEKDCKLNEFLMMEVSNLS